MRSSSLRSCMDSLFFLHLKWTSDRRYCRAPAGYYPDVQTCPSGWLQVVPNG